MNEGKPKWKPPSWYLKIAIWSSIFFSLLGLSFNKINDTMAYDSPNLNLDGVIFPLPHCVADEKPIEPPRRIGQIRESPKANIEKEVPEGSQTRKVSWYDAIPDGINCDDPNCITASGEPYNPEDLTCACEPRFPLGTHFRVSHGGNSVVVRCNDRGAFWQAKYGYKMLDLSKKAFESLAPLSRGVITAEINVIN